MVNDTWHTVFAFNYPDTLYKSVSNEYTVGFRYEHGFYKVQPYGRAKFSEIAQDLGFWTQNCTIFHPFILFGYFCNFWGVFCPILFAQDFPTKLLVAPNNWLDKIKN